MLYYSPTKTQELLGNPDKSAYPTASSPACAGLAGEHCTTLLSDQYLQSDDRIRIVTVHNIYLQTDSSETMKPFSERRRA